MSDKKVFSEGIYFNAPHERAPEFVIGKLSIARERFIGWLEQQTASEKGYVNLQIKKSRDGKIYIELDSWQPGERAEPRREPAGPVVEDFNDDIPFDAHERGWLAG